MDKFSQVTLAMRALLALNVAAVTMLGGLLFTSQPAAAAATKCQIADLRLSVAYSNGAAGSFFYNVRFKNTSTHACTISGFPTIFLVDNNGSTIKTPAKVSPSQYTVVTLQPGSTAHAVMDIPDSNIASRCVNRVATALRVTPFSVVGSLQTPFAKPSGFPPIKWCPNFSATRVAAGLGY